MFTTTDHMYVLAFYGQTDFFFNATYSHIDSKCLFYKLVNIFHRRNVKVLRALRAKIAPFEIGLSF